MALSDKTIRALEKLFTGDGALPPAGTRIAPYRTGPELVGFFNRFGFSETYGQGFPTRYVYVQRKLRELEGSPNFARAVEAALHPREFLDTTYDAAVAVEYVNRYLTLDGMEVLSVGGRYRLRSLPQPGVAIDAQLLTSDDALTDIFVKEQVEKCERKLAEGDYDGSITNARTLVEAVLKEAERRLNPEPPPYDGDLPKLYKRVQRLLNLGPEREDLAEPLRLVLRGLASIIAGLAPMRNSMSDAHPARHRPQRRHAALAVNAAKTLSGFVLESYEYQVQAGRLRRPAEPPREC